MLVSPVGRGYVDMLALVTEVVERAAEVAGVCRLDTAGAQDRLEMYRHLRQLHSVVQGQGGPPVL